MYVGELHLWKEMTHLQSRDGDTCFFGWLESLGTIDCIALFWPVVTVLIVMSFLLATAWVNQFVYHYYLQVKKQNRCSNLWSDLSLPHQMRVTSVLKTEFSMSAPVFVNHLFAAFYALQGRQNMIGYPHFATVKWICEKSIIIYFPALLFRFSLWWRRQVFYGPQRSSAGECFTWITW